MPANHDRRQRELLDAVWDDYDGDAFRRAYAAWLGSTDDPVDFSAESAPRSDPDRVSDAIPFGKSDPERQNIQQFD